GEFVVGRGGNRPVDVCGRRTFIGDGCVAGLLPTGASRVARGSASGLAPGIRSVDMRLPILVFHICGGLLGLLSGAAAMSFRKGSGRHRVAGNVFVISMLSMAASAAYLGNVGGSVITIYLVTTAWVTGRRRAGETSIFDWGAMLFALAFG